MANKNLFSFTFKPVHLFAVITIIFLAFAAGFAAGDDEGSRRGYRNGERTGLELGRINGELKVHEMWTTATEFGAIAPNKNAVKLIEGYVYGK